MASAFWPRAERPARERRYVSAVEPARGARAGFDRQAFDEIARAAMPGVPIRDRVWLHEYDGYYYDARGSRTLPVLRVRYDDPQQTWLYLDPRRGAIVQKSESTSRLRRWLYQGLHSLDFPSLYFRRPLWDIVVIALSVGGTVLSVTTLLPAWRRLRRHLARAGHRWRSAPSPVRALPVAAGRMAIRPPAETTSATSRATELAHDLSPRR
jgi:hypothetical protein